MTLSGESTGAPLGSAQTRAEPPTTLQASTRRFLRGVFGSEYFVLYLIIVYFIILIPFLPVLTRPQNLANVLSNVWPLLAVAVGQTFVLIIAGIDLSQGAVMGLTSVVGAMLFATAADPDVLSKSPLWGWMITENGGLLNGSPLAIPLGIAAMLAVGLLIGWLNGVAVARFNMPPFMVTLVTLTFIGAFAIFLTQSENIRNLPEPYIQLGKGSIISVYFGEAVESQIARRDLNPLITPPLLIAVRLAAAAQWILGRTTFGRYLYAIGANRRAAAISGVPTQRVIILTFMFSSLCATIGGLLYSARLEAGRPTLGAGNFLLDVVGATVIGGTSLFGGKGKVLWTFFGVLFFMLLSNTLNLMNLSTFHIDMVKGLVILAAALIDVTRTRLMARGA